MLTFHSFQQSEILLSLSLCYPPIGKQQYLWESLGSHVFEGFVACTSFRHWHILWQINILFMVGTLNGATPKDTYKAMILIQQKINFKI